MVTFTISVNPTFQSLNCLNNVDLSSRNGDRGSKNQKTLAFIPSVPVSKSILEKNILTSLDCCQEMQNPDIVYICCLPHMFCMLKIYRVQFKAKV